ncbi:MAG TPA: hypothetical protein VLL54_16075 [Pyrinomonadaceae bacterium]|nr:hypothetical protein [Pyrinomonadaceae bacterium]
MLVRKWLIFVVSLVFAASMAGCKMGSKSKTSGSSNSATQADGGETGVEKVKPAAGTGNVQGKVLYNDKPAENIEVKLCEKFNRFFGGCSGKTFTGKTGKDGEYVITNVEPLQYEVLMARVFDTDSFIFATSGLAGISAKKYEVVADKTLFAPTTNLYKGDLKLVNPKAGAKVSADKLELKWDAYPDAAYYKFSIFPEEASVTSPYVNERVDGTTFTLDKPLQKGTYRWQVEAYSGSDKKLSESSNDIKFTIN